LAVQWDVMPEGFDAFSDTVIDDVICHEFGWDNESPRRIVQVGRFNLSTWPIRNGEFYEFHGGEGAGKPNFLQVSVLPMAKYRFYGCAYRFYGICPSLAHRRIIQ